MPNHEQTSGSQDWATATLRAASWSFLPHFRVSEMMVTVEGAPLGRTAVSRKLVVIGHAEFRRLLMEKAAVHGCRVFFVRGMLACLLTYLFIVCCRLRMYTGNNCCVAADRRGVEKTCSSCGHVNHGPPGIGAP